ncbi:NfeD family protein [Geoglobus ahangari]
MEKLLAPILAILCILAFTPLASGAIVEVKIEGTINEGTYVTLENAMELAKERNADALLIVVNTPGGLVSSTEKIISLILNSEIPVLTYVPPGSFSASAGSLIVVSANVAGMANGTSIGAATPISVGVGEPRVEEKAVKYLASYAKAIAEKRGRNETAIERFVTEAYSASAKEAYRYGIIDVLADSKLEFLRKVDGMVVETSTGERVLNTKDAEIVVAEKPLKAKVLELLTSPELASILLIIGIYGLIFGLTSPGMGAEVLGAICLLLALFGLGIIGVNYMGILLILLGIAFLIAELLTPTYGVLGVASIVCIVLGTLMLYDEPLMPRDFYTSFPMLVGGIASGLGIIMTYAIVKVVQLRKMRKKVGAEALIGERGEVVIFSGGKGMAKVHGELWRIESEEELSRGDEIVVVGRDGLTLKVKKYEPRERAEERDG